MIHKRDFQTGAAHSDRGLLEIKQALTSADWEIAHQMLDEEHFPWRGSRGRRSTLPVRARGRTSRRRAHLVRCRLASQRSRYNHRLGSRHPLATA